MATRVRRRLADDRGFTLIEMLVAMIGGIAVAGAAMAFLIVSSDQQNDAGSRSAATSQAEIGLQRLTRDLRGAMYESTSSTATYGVTVSTNASAETTSVTLDIPTSTSSGETTANDGTGVPVTWTCPSAAEGANYIGACTRSVNGGTAIPMISGVQSVTFTPYNSAGVSQTLSTTSNASFSNPSSVGISLAVQEVSQLDSTGSHLVTGTSNRIMLQTSADLRNFP